MNYISKKGGQAYSYLLQPFIIRKSLIFIINSSMVRTIEKWTKETVINLSGVLLALQEKIWRLLRSVTSPSVSPSTGIPYALQYQACNNTRKTNHCEFLNCLYVYLPEEQQCRQYFKKCNNRNHTQLFRVKYL